VKCVRGIKSVKDIKPIPWLDELKRGEKMKGKLQAFIVKAA